MVPLKALSNQGSIRYQCLNSYQQLDINSYQQAMYIVYRSQMMGTIRSAYRNRVLGLLSIYKLTLFKYLMPQVNMN